MAPNKTTRGGISLRRRVTVWLFARGRGAPGGFLTAGWEEEVKTL